MQQLTIEIPDNKIAFFLELANSLGFKVYNNKNILNRDQIDLVNDERRKIKKAPGHFLDWEEARKSFNLD
jgi:hypothetical protein